MTEIVMKVQDEAEVLLDVSDSLIATGFAGRSYYASENPNENPAQTLGFGTWRKIPPANTVNQLLAQNAEDDFVVTGSLYVWRRMA